MANLWKKFKGRYLTDRADSILVPAMILAPVLALLVGITVEVGKNSYIRSERTNAIQDSASAAVKTVDTRGSLNWKVVDKVVNEYERNRFGAKKFSSATPAANSFKDSAESQAFDSFDGESCLSDDEGRKYPQYKISLLEGRGDESAAAPTVSFSRTQPTLSNLNVSNRLPAKTIYRGLRVEIIDQTPNFMMSLAGAPCQKFTLTASAVTFAADSDAGQVPPL